MAGDGGRVWYFSYGSNMSGRRFELYIRGGSMPGANRNHPGCRDATPATDSRGMWAPGQVYFALESKVWGCGMALLDPCREGQAAGRGHLITVPQLCDLLAQEMHAEPGSVTIDVGEVVRCGAVSLGDGRYETVLHVGEAEGVPVLTFTAPRRLEPVRPPSPTYLRVLAEGLREAHGLSGRQAAEYLSTLPGADTLGERAILAALYPEGITGG